MSQPAQRQQRVTVAIPASLTLDIPHLREKTARIGYLGRSLAIFRIDHVLVYLDQDNDAARRESRLVEKILKFQETPPYLRRELFRVDEDLAFTGVLPPLRTASHPDRKQPEVGAVRDAIVRSSGKSSEVNAGFLQPVFVDASLKIRSRVTVRITSVHPKLAGEIVDPSRLAIYWGVQVTRDERALGQLLKRRSQDLIISTSREGTDIRKVTEPIREQWVHAKNPLIIFGSPTEGIPEILVRTNDALPANSFNINTFPLQGTETVRTEEAVLGTLAILNMLVEA